jgi:hypothetical protein
VATLSTWASCSGLRAQGRFGLKVRARSLSQHMLGVIAKLRELAPYAAIELVLPGGSLMALALWLYRRRRITSAFATSEILSLL